MCLTYNHFLDANWGKLAMAELSKLGRYQLRRILGRGAMGVVYEGFDPDLSRRVAVKTILKGDEFDAETQRAYAARFIQEAKAVARLNHPNIVQVYDFGVEGEVAYLVMEFIEGRELRGFFTANESFGIADSVRIMCELLDALDFAHEAGVIHRDVKPANVMLDAQRRVKLADFGVARIQDSAQRSGADTMVGTPAFMSPEQISGAKIDRRTDIFSAGNILYQLLTGEQPFKGEGAWTVVKAIMQDDPPQPSSIVTNISPVFDTIVNKALAKKPADRFATAREFATELRSVLAKGQQPTAAPAPKQKPRIETRATETELEFWRAIQNSSDPAELELYVEQFPDGAYSKLARLKIAKLMEPIEAARKVAEEKARLEAEERARKEAEARAQREAEEEKKREAERKARAEAEAAARREAEAKAKREAEEKARREAQEKARHDALEKAKREAAEKAKREAEEKARQAQALARLKQQEAAARAKAVVDEDATVAIGSARPIAIPPEPPAAQKKSLTVPAIAAAVVIIAGIVAYVLLGRPPAPVPVPVAEIPSVQKAIPPTPPAVDGEKVQRETEERLRKEFAEKEAAQLAALEKEVAEKLAGEKSAADKLAQAKTATDKAEAEKAMQKAAAEKAAADKAAADKAAQTKAAAEKTAAEAAAAEKAAAEKAAADKIAAEKAAADKQAGDKTVAEKESTAKAAAVAAKPGWPNVGDRWVYEARDVFAGTKYPVTVEVKELTASTVRDVLKAGGSAPVEWVHKPGAYLIGLAPGILNFSPYLSALQEIRIGQSWSNVNLVRLPFCQEVLSCKTSARVMGRERVTVKAGSFEAWKIEVELQFHDQGGWSGTVSLKYWYVEELRRIVRYQSRGPGYHNNAVNWMEPDMDMELVSYTPAVATSAAAEKAVLEKAKAEPCFVASCTGVVPGHNKEGH
jgi:serine/threonine-protein kinase